MRLAVAPPQPAAACQRDANYLLASTGRGTYRRLVMTAVRQWAPRRTLHDAAGRTGDISMTEWIETYRGVVSAWECDIVEHFTIAYY
jgi:hypothetical protein